MVTSSYPITLIGLTVGNDSREHCAVKGELLVKVGLGGALPNDGEKKGLVSQVFCPKGEDSLPGWGEVLTFCQNMEEGTRSGI